MRWIALYALALLVLGGIALIVVGVLACIDGAYAPGAVAFLVAPIAILTGSAILYEEIRHPYL